MDKKKVLHVITKSNFGGAQRYVYDLATELPDGGYESVVALGGNGELKERLDNAGVKTIVIDKLARDVSIFKEFSVFWDFLKLFKHEKPDIVHLNSSKVGGLGSLAARMSGVPNIIFTGHGWAFNENRNAVSKTIIFILYVIIITLSDRTIAVSNITKRQIARRVPFLRNKMPVIYNGMSKINFVSKDDARDHIYSFVEDKNLDKKSIWIGTVGELHHIKGHKYLIEAFSELKARNHSPDIKLVIVSDGEERANLEKLIHERRLNKDVFLTGSIKDARRFLRAFDIFVFPSLSEAMPYAVMEAGLAGLPVIATDVGGIPEIIKRSNSGILIHSKDVFEITDNLNKLIEDKHLRESLGQELQKDVSLQFSREKMVSETVKVYER